MLLITSDEVLAYAFSPREKIAPGSIRRAKIDVAQEHFIRPVVGAAMFDRLTGGEFRPFVNEYIKPALAHYVRYGIINEFSIRMGDDGAVLIQGEDMDSTASRTTVEHTGTTRESSGNEEATVAKTAESETTAGETGDTVTTGKETKKITVAQTAPNSTSSNETSDTTATDDETKTVTVSKNSTDRQSDSSHTDKTTSASSSDSKDGNSSITSQDGRRLVQYRPATDAQRSLIMRRSLADADILMAKAVRYLIRNAALFPGFDPQTIRPSGIITGFSSLNDGGSWR